MEVILLTDVPHVGRLGEQKRVATGFARNYLFPKRLAAPSTPQAKRQIERQLEKKRSLLESQHQDAIKLAEQLKGVEIQIPCAAGDDGRLFGSITTRMIADHLKAKGYTLDKKLIVMEAPIRTLGSHKVTVRVHPDSPAEISVVVVSQNA